MMHVVFERGNYLKAGQLLAVRATDALVKKFKILISGTSPAGTVDLLETDDGNSHLTPVQTMPASGVMTYTLSTHHPTYNIVQVLTKSGAANRALTIQALGNDDKVLKETTLRVNPGNRVYKQLATLGSFDEERAAFIASEMEREAMIGERFSWNVRIIPYDVEESSEEIVIDLGTCAPFQIPLAPSQIETAQGAYSKVQTDIDIALRSFSPETAVMLASLEQMQFDMATKKLKTGRSYRGVAQVQFLSDSNKYAFVINDVQVLQSGNIASNGLTDNSADNRNGIRLSLDQKSQEIWLGLIQL